MTDEEQIAADLAPGPHDIPESVLYSPPPTSYSGEDFNKSQAFLYGEGSEEQARLAAVQAAQDKIQRWLSTFHGAEPADLGRLRQQVAGGKMSGSDYYAMTGRIYAGGTGDTPTRDARGNITGYTAPDGSGSALGGPSATPGLDAFHEMNPGAPSSPGLSFSDDRSGPPLPGSVAAHVGAPTPGMAMAADTLTFDTRLQTPTRQSVQGAKSDGSTRSLSSNNRLAAAASQAGTKTANAAIRANFKAAGLPDPAIAPNTLNLPGGGSITTPGNLGAKPWPKR